MLTARITSWRRTFRAPFAFGGTTLDARTGWWLDLLRRSPDGALDAGRGDCAPLPGFGTGSREANLDALVRLAGDGATLAALERALADPPEASIERARAALDAAALPPAARAAVETAWLALAARRAGCDPCECLVDAPAPSVGSNGVVGDLPAPRAAAAVVALAERGVRVVKVKRAQLPDPEWLDTLDAALHDHPDLRLRIDANQGWGEPAAALVALEACARHPIGRRIDYVEEPASDPDWPWLLARAPLALGIDESLPDLPGGPASLLDTPARVAPVYVLKPSALGGPLTTLALVRRLAARGARATVTSLLDSESGVAMAREVARAVEGLGAGTGAHGLATLELFEPAPLRAPRDPDPAHPRSPCDVDWFAIHRRSTPDRVALVERAPGRPRSVTTFAELDALADAMAERLPSTGARVGLTAAPPRAVWALVIAAWRRRACLVGVHPARSTGERDAQLRAAGATWVLNPEGQLEPLSPNRPTEPAPPVGGPSSGVSGSPAHARLATADLGSAPADPEILDYETWFWERAACAPAGPDASDESPFLILYTSGTTGTPKAAVLSRRALLASALAHALHAGVPEPGGWLMCMPPWHVGGLSILTRSLFYGTPVVALPAFDVAAVRDALARESVGAVSLVPTMLHRLMEAGVSPGASLRLAMVGGGPVGAELLTRAQEAGWPVVPTWGMTEYASQAATGRLPAWPDTAGSDEGAGPDEAGPVRVPLVPGARVRGVVSGSAPGEAGAGVVELTLRGPSLFSGYLRGEGAWDHSAFDGDGFLRTGDLGRLTSAGGEVLVEIVNRRADLIVSGGENVYPSEVERRIRALDGALEVAVGGVDDAEWGQVVGALVVMAPGRTVEALRAAARAALPRYQLPRVWVEVGAIPRGPTGKVLTERVRALLARAPRAAAGAAPSAGVEDCETSTTSLASPRGSDKTSGE